MPMRHGLPRFLQLLARPDLDPFDPSLALSRSRLRSKALMSSSSHAPQHPIGSLGHAGSSGPDVPDAESAYEALRQTLAPRFAPGLKPPVLVGIHSGGAWVAERLHQALCPEAPIGFLSSAFHRDDFSSRGLQAGGQRGTTRIDFKVEGADILLIDDVLYTGRTIRAALNELFDYGRPRRVDLAVLVDRGGRELPVHAEAAGCRLDLDPELSLVLGREAGRFVFTVEGA